MLPLADLPDFMTEWWFLILMAVVFLLLILLIPLTALAVVWFASKKNKPESVRRDQGEGWREKG
jgi:hypothetical protein